MRKVLGVILLSLLAAVAGCERMGVGGTGETVIPPQQLRNIAGTEMRTMSVVPPTTLPATLPSTQPATRPAVPPPEVRLTVEQVRELALRHNLDLQVELLNPTIAEQAVSEEQAAFESVFSNTLRYDATDAPRFGGTARDPRIVGDPSTRWQDTPGLRVPLRTGGEIGLDLPVSRTDSDGTPDATYASDLAASISHPLLRGAGLDVNAQRIRIAFYQFQQTQARTKLEIIRVLAEADRTYWRLYATERELEVRNKEYELAVALLDRARRQVRLGAAAAPDVVRAESGVADRVEAIILAQNQLRDRQRELKRILNAPELPMGGPTVIVPASQPNPVYYRVDPEQLVQTALAQRMEMLDLELQIAAETSNIRFARNQMLPFVALDYTYRVNGLGNSASDSFEVLRDKDFEDHGIGLRLEVPIGNEAARSRLRRALASRLQKLRTRDQRILQIRQEALGALDQLEASYQRIMAARSRVVAASRVLDVETRQFGLGLRTSTDVLEAQANLANAQSSEILALTEYQVAQIDIAYATGTLLGAAHVAWQPTPAPRK